MESAVSKLTSRCDLRPTFIRFTFYMILHVRSFFEGEFDEKHFDSVGTFDLKTLEILVICFMIGEKIRCVRFHFSPDPE